MRLLLDTQLIVTLVNNEGDRQKLRLLDSVAASGLEASASVVSLWEIAIKARLAKLHLRMALHDIPERLTLGKIEIVDIRRAHVLEDLTVLPETRDPFDRLLLAQCQVEKMHLVTTDGDLEDHPLAWKP